MNNIFGLTILIIGVNINRTISAIVSTTVSMRNTFLTNFFLLGNFEDI